MSALLELDRQIVLGFNAWIANTTGLLYLIRVIALYGVYIIPVTWIVRWFFVGKRERELMMSAVAAGLVAWEGVNRILKLLYFHPRPSQSLPVKELLFERPENAFPSDHVAFIAGMAFFYFLKRGSNNNLGIGLFILAVLVGISRVAVAVHYPTDIVVAIASGFVGAWVVHFLHDFLCDTLWDKLLRFATKLRLA